MADKPLPTPHELRQLLTYNPETGDLIWRARTPEMFLRGTPEAACKMWNKKFSGKPAFTYVGLDGYLHGTIKPWRLPAHRVAWAIFHDAWPMGQIDHINGVRTDNRLANLRDVTVTENNRNCALRKTNRSGVTGVHFNRFCGKWTAQIRIDGKARHLGLFDSLQDAASARKSAEALIGFHPNHGRPAMIAATQDQLAHLLEDEA